MRTTHSRVIQACARPAQLLDGPQNIGTDVLRHYPTC